MSRKRACAGALFVLVSWAWLSPLQPCWAQTPSLGSRAPVLMWQYGGCIPGPYCNTGWHSSPVVADLNGDGQQDVIWGSYDVVALNGADGSLKWRAPSGNRVWPGIAVADLTGNGTLEVIVGRDSDQLTVYDRFGGVVWTRNPFGGSDELRSVAVADLDKDGQLEIITGQAAGEAHRQLNVLEANGTDRPGWPARHDVEPGDTFGMWNQSVVVADMNSDGFMELFVPGGHYINAFDRNGNQLTVNPIFAPRQFWSEVGVHVDQAVDLRGYANCGVDHRPSFDYSAPVVADVDGDGVPELIVVGNIYNCGTTPYTSLYHMPFIFKLDRTRWSGSGFDWTVIPTPGPGSAPRSEDYNVIENVVPNAVVADLDGDGLKEILFPSYDGKVHAYWLDKTEHGSWPYTVPTSGTPGDDFRFASEPVVVDLDNDGHAEVIFTSWPKKATGGVGQLHVLDYLGRELYRVSLPAPSIGKNWNGGLGAPTIANIDSDPDLELVVGTSASGVVAYKLPTTANARVLWGTGRGNYGRTGVPGTVTAPPPPDTTPPTVSITSPTNGATVPATVTITASAADNVGVAGVQFRIDGVNFGAEDTTAPYSISWNTTAAANGSHTITALARDAAGNNTPSAPVTVTVANVPPPPPDATPPTVSITSPGNGAPVKGTVIVTASASDNVGVVGVQFLLDNGVNGSVDVTTAPYSISWNTATVSDGPHKITAIARDAAGNSTPSAPVTVTVNNNAPPPPPPVARFEDTDPSIAYNGFWRPDVYAALSNGGATVSDQAGVQATFTFTGTSVRWIGGRWVEEGIARVFLDGSFVTEVDTYSKTKEVQVPLFTAVGLADTSHTLTIEVTGRKNIASNLPFVLVDAFDVPAATISRLQETDPAVTFAGSGWLQGVTGAEYSGGTVAGSLTAGDQATLTFTGTGVRWLGELGPATGGIARVHPDGAFMQEVNTYAPSPDPGHHSTFQAEHFKATGLADTSHTLTIEVTGRQDPAAAKATVVVDAFDVITSGTRRQETDPAVSYTAGWLQGNRDHPYSEGTAAVSTIPGDRATFIFTGTSVSWIGYRGPQAGIARGILDGSVVRDSRDLYIPSEGPQEAVFTLPGLAAGSHTLTIEVTGSKNPASLGVSIVVDAFDVTP